LFFLSKSNKKKASDQLTTVHWPGNFNLILSQTERTSDCN